MVFQSWKTDISQRNNIDLHGSLGSPCPQILKYEVWFPGFEVILNECCKEGEASTEGLPRKWRVRIICYLSGIQKYRRNDDLNRNVHFRYLKNPTLCQPKCYLAIKCMILAHCPFIVVCPPFSCNGDRKEEWYGAGAGGREGGLMALKSPQGTGFEKYRMMDLGVGGENFANTAQ